MVDNSILSNLIYKSEMGSLEFSDVRYLLIRPETLAEFQKSIEVEIGHSKAAKILYEGGFTGGKLSGRKYKQEFNLSDEEAVEYMCRMGGEIGWGSMQLQSIDSAAHKLMLKVSHSPFAQSYGESSNGVCHLIRGVFGGLASELFNIEVEAKEVNCSACGDAFCLFEIKKINH